MTLQYRKHRNEGCRIIDDLSYRGYRSLILENDLLQIMLLPGKGGEPVRWLHKPTDTDFIWQTRAGLLPASPLYADYQSSYLGGWQDMLPEVSETHIYRGALVHRGESAITPWDCRIVQDDREQIMVKLTNRLRSLPLFLEKTISLRLGEASVHMEQKVMNESPVSVEFNWGHHLAYGSPFLNRDSKIYFSPDSVVLNPATGEKRRWPMAPGTAGIDLSAMAEPGSARELLAVEATDGAYRILNESLDLALDVRWDRNVWPYVWYWQNFAADPDGPFFACEYNIGLEPFNVPPKWTLAEAAARSAALSVKPHGSLESWLEISVAKAVKHE